MRGQYFSFDAIIGGVIFILTAMALFSYWYGITSSFDQRHEMLSKEAFRISEMLMAPVEPGVAVGWRDPHFNYSLVARESDGCDWDGQSPQNAFGSPYPVFVSFNEISSSGGIREICPWGDKGFQSDNVYRFRRTLSYLHGDGRTSLGFVDIFIYEPPAQ